MTVTPCTDVSEKNRAFMAVGESRSALKLGRIMFLKEISVKNIPAAT
jgi:hypothetical protein